MSVHFNGQVCLNRTIKAILFADVFLGLFFFLNLESPFPTHYHHLVNFLYNTVFAHTTFLARGGRVGSHRLSCANSRRRNNSKKMAMNAKNHQTNAISRQDNKLTVNL